jgi:FAD:protein FMN transferase
MACSRFRPDSELSKMNQSGGQWVRIGPVFLEALQAALWAARATGGLVDPTVGGSLRAIGYDRDFKSLAEDDPSPLRLQVVPGWQALDLDRDQSRVRVPKGVELDLGATAKGLAADKAAVAARKAAGEGGVLVSLGGDISVAGPPPEGGWLVLVTDDATREDDKTGALVSLGQGGLATSSTTVRRWRREGRLLHHIIDPATGLSADSPWLFVTVTANTCLEANAAATAAIILGEAALEWLARQKLPSRLVRLDHTVERIAGWPDEDPRNLSDAKNVI